MRKNIFAVALLAVAAFAQEGHPAVGTWHGNWGANAQNRNDVTVVMDWDGKQIGGMINPGPDSVKLVNTSLAVSNDPNNWVIHLEGDTKAKVHIVIEGKFQNLTNMRRSIAGTWKQGTQSGDFKITRDN